MVLLSREGGREGVRGFGTRFKGGSEARSRLAKAKGKGKW